MYVTVAVQKTWAGAVTDGNLVRPSSLLGHRTEATGCKGQPAATGTGPENMLALYLLLKLFS